MGKLATICGTILALILCASTLAAYHLPPNMTLGFTLFAGCLAGVLALSARLAVEDRRRGKHAD
ncbi:MAG: hypothetical protein IAI49_01050 [Candidatus Eremiobacteraeota bacterium]|nr:hypothetical protein [Candidatus Eremiobacteraeota bacterium]